MADKSNEFKMGTELEGEVPSDAEVIEGTQPSDPIPEEDAQGRGDDHHHHYRNVACPYHDCHATNRVLSNVHYVHCWHCHRTFHA